MVAVIHSSTGFRRAVHYNEIKVDEQKARCLAAVNYPKDADDLTFSQKINRLQHQAKLNERTKVNCVHISLNFDPSEKLSPEKMLAIAQSYMGKMGFGDQPYLVYQHRDAGHPHVHIVTTNIKRDGKRIPLHNIGRDRSEPSRQEIEKEFDLVHAGARPPRDPYTIPPVKISYEKTESKRAVTQVVNHVLKEYKFTSLEEFNAVLKMYNVKAERGQPGSRTFERGGLVYRLLDEQGIPVGNPIKASDLFMKPTLKVVEKHYAQNEGMRKPHRQRLKTTIDWTLHGGNLMLTAFVKGLEKEGIEVILRTNKDGIMYGITYIDHRSKCVFNGSDLGKAYSAQAIQERCAGTQTWHLGTTPLQLAAQESTIADHRSKLLTMPQWQAAHASSEASPNISTPFRKKKGRRPKL